MPDFKVVVASRPPTPPEAGAPTMVAIPAGTFMMGSADGSPDEKPVHAVTLGAFELDANEVTVRDYKTCVDTAACREPDIGVDCNWGKRDRGEHPINCVSWNDAVAYCTFAKKRLPTEEEWEYAARGTVDARYPWGNAPPGELCWKRHVGEGTCPVGSFAPSTTALGVHDMAGNVWEWTSNRFCPYSSKHCAREARVYRGGAWLSSSPEAIVAWSRQKDEPTSRSSVVGFRCARDS
jgi:formylglycine-generating enzyme required for sulfatase activity